MSKIKTAITPTRSENYPEWYQGVLKAADLSEHSPVRGCMVIKPWGYSIWENIQKRLDAKFKETGHQNAYFPLFIPLSFLEKEAAHVEGFAKECAVVTHHRLEKGPDGKLIPAGELEEPLIVRPTSEMIIGHSFSKWIKSYRDLPLMINQWCNVVRWEMRTRMFLRTTEFLWQEGHTAHATRLEAEIEAKAMLKLYADFAKNYLAIPVICGEKTESERFPGAVNTYTIEAMMQDKKALQAGTSHFLGQNFAKSCEIQFQSESGSLEHVWTTSWGVTTRLIGALIMVHSDDDGLVLPPKVAATHVVIIPVIHKEETSQEILDYCEKLKSKISQGIFDCEPVKVAIDKRDLRAGEKSWSWIKKGAPLRIEIGQREMQSSHVAIARRDMAHKEMTSLDFDRLDTQIPDLLHQMHDNLLAKATAFRDSNIVKITDLKDFYSFFKGKEDEISGGFALCHFNGDAQFEEKIKKDLNVTARCIPLDIPPTEGICIFSGQKTSQMVIFARSY